MAEGGDSSFVDASKSVGLTDARQPVSVSQAVFLGELGDRECAELDHAGRTISTEQNSSISSQSCYGHGELRDHGRGELPDLGRFVSEISNARQDTVVRASYLTWIVPSG